MYVKYVKLKKPSKDLNMIFFYFIFQFLVICLLIYYNYFRTFAFYSIYPCLYVREQAMNFFHYFKNAI